MGGATAAANMWAHLRDNDPGHDADDDDRKHEVGPGADAPKVVEEAEAPPADNVIDGAGKRSKKTKKKKGAGKKKTDQEEETPAAPPSKEEMNGASRCRAVTRRICRAAVMGALLALWCHLTSAPPVAAGRVV
jgi:hypothetical protein